MKKWKKRSLAILSFFVLLIGVLLILIYTSAGIRLATTVLEKVMPEIKIGQVTGSLTDLTLEKFALEMDGLEVKVENAHITLSGLCLIKGQVCVKALGADNIQVNIDTDKLSSDPAQEENEPVETERFVVDMPFPIELRSANLTHVEVNVDDMTFALDSFESKADWVNHRIHVYPTVAMGVKALFADPPEHPLPVDSEPTLSLDKQINALFNEPLLSGLPDVSIPLDITVDSLKGENWLLRMGGQDYTFDGVAIKAATEDNHIIVDSLETDATSPYAQGQVTVAGDIVLGQAWPLSATIAIVTDSLNAQIPTKVTGKFAGQLLGTLATQTEMTGLNTVSVEAKLNFIEKHLPLTAKVSGDYLQWPLAGEPTYQLNNFMFELSGLVTQYQLQAAGKVKGTDIPETQFDVQSHGTNQQFNLEHATIVLPQGKISSQGQLGWVDKLTWDVGVQLEHVDLKKIRPDYPILLNGNVQSQGELADNYWQIALPVIQLEGSVNRAPLKSSGSLSIDSDYLIKANNFNLQWGKNTLRINGIADNNANLLAKLNFTDLKVVMPNLYGSIVGELNLKGKLLEPQLTTNLQISNLTWQDLHLNRATINGKVQYQGQASGQLTVQANNVIYSGLDFKQVSLNLSGNEAQHVLSLTVDGQPLASQLHLTGQLNKDRSKWTGELSDTELSLNKNPLLVLSRSLLLSYDISEQLATVNAHCWLNTAGKLCLTKNVVFAPQGTATIELSGFDLAQFNQQLSSNSTKLAGLLNGKVDIKWNESTLIPTVVAHFSGQSVRIEQMVASQVLPIPFDLFELNANISDKQAKADWNFSLQEFGKFKGNVVISDPMNRKTLSGQVVIDNLLLALLNPLMQGDDRANGTVNAQLRLGGTLLDPSLTGDLDIAQSEIKASQLPADVRAINLHIDFNGKSSVLAGQIQTEEGEIKIAGAADWRNLDKWRAWLTVKGAAMQVVVPPMVKLSLVPDIRVDAGPNDLSIAGKVLIPKARITVEELPASTVDVSDDEVMLDSQLQPIVTAPSSFKINSELMIEIGDDVVVEGYGLNANLKGVLAIKQTPKGLGANGQILISQGRFKAYGQDLIIRHGEINFAGTINQPHLYIEAIRNPDSIEDKVTAGLRVTGTPDDPQIEIFSDPAMEQQEALSYLLRGQGLNTSEQSENDMMTALLIGLGTAQGGKYVGDIGNLFGISNLALDTQGVGNDQQVVVSGYFTPDLQLKYGVGIFDSIATFTLRYRLMTKLYLEAASGAAQTMDLIYQFDWH